MMYILAFETTGKNASVACIDEKGGLVCEESDGVYNHLQSLMPMTKSLMEKNGIVVSDISCVAASAGPGSFTGIRIGVATARAFAQAAGVSCVSVPTLQAFVYNTPGYRGLVCPILDARREQVYGGAYSLDDGEEIHEAVEGGAYEIEEYLFQLMRKTAESGIMDVLFFGDGVKLYQSEIERQCNNLRIEFAESESRFQKASSAAKLALKLYNEKKQISYNAFKPSYMRKAEAERKLEAGYDRFSDKTSK